MFKDNQGKNRCLHEEPAGVDSRTGGGILKSSPKPKNTFLHDSRCWSDRMSPTSTCAHFSLFLMMLVMAACRIDPCDYHECLNGGVCDDWECICEEGWMGEDCSIPNCKPVEFNGYTYETVGIGIQCWFAENLRTAKYSNGDDIPGNLDDDSWSTTNQGAQAILWDSAVNLELYGRLYNWYAVKDARGLCPVGWHVPSDEEWMQLEMELGLSPELANSEGQRGRVGSLLKSSPFDSPPWDGSWASVFKGLPGRARYESGEYANPPDWGLFGIWWSSPTDDDSTPWFRSVEQNDVRATRDYILVRTGSSVRCVRD